VDYRDDLLNLRTACKLKLPQLTQGGAEQAAASEGQNKKTLPIATHLPRIQQSFSLNTNTRTGFWRSNNKT
jgi:hypothetical protein